MLIAAERERPGVAERREELQREQPLLNPDRLVFIDETWVNTNMNRPRGRAPGATACWPACLTVIGR